MDSSVPLAPRELFGGAMRFHAPASWLDTEAFMDIIEGAVPDNQEIFVAPSTSSSVEADAPRPLALFVDVLEAATEACPDMNAAPHFHAIELLKRDERTAEADSLEQAPVHAVELPTDVRAQGGDGVAASCALFPASDIDVCVVRLPRVRTDLVLSLHGRKDRLEVCPSLSTIVASLEILDWGLFGDEVPSEGDDGPPRYLGS